VKTALPVGVATMGKRFQGGGRGAEQLVIDPAGGADALRSIHSIGGLHLPDSAAVVAPRHRLHANFSLSRRRLRTVPRVTLNGTSPARPSH
jgi:hypothetical protein